MSKNPTEIKSKYLEDLINPKRIEEKEFLIKLNTEQFRKLFPKREQTFTSFNEKNEPIIIDTIPIPEDCILCDYGCNKNLVNEEFFYLLMINKDLCQGTVCKECYTSWNSKSLEIKEFEEVFES